MGRVLVLDLEANGFLMDATVIHCIVLKDIHTNEIFPFRPEQIKEAFEMIKEADQLIGHNIILYDLPLIKRLYDLDFIYKNIVDTVLWSRLLKPDRDGGHSLDAWGQRLGLLKGQFTDFSTFSEEMLEYCIQDVEVAHKLYLHFDRQDKFEDQPWKAIKVEHDFAKVISKQILDGFYLNEKFTRDLLKELTDEYSNVYSRLVDIMPRMHRTSHYETTKRSGRVISESDVEYTYTAGQSEKIKTKKFEWIEGNPRSRQQIITYFKDKYNWVPSKTTEKDNPIIDETVLGGLAFPEAKLFARMFRLNKQIAMMGDESGWLSFLIEGRVHGNMITNGAVTGRCTHSKPNLAQVDKKDIRMRDCWQAPQGLALVSADAEQLEARILAHYLAPYDNGMLTQTLLEGDFHEQNRIACNFADRKSAKTLLYAFIYGAGDMKLAKTAKTDPNFANYRGNEYSLGKQMRENLINSILGIDKLQQHIALAVNNRGYLLGLDGRPLWVRSAHAALNTLLQSGGAVIMKLTLIDWYDKVKLMDDNLKLCANVHDEIVFECTPEMAAKLGVMFQESMHNVAQSLNFKCPLEAAYKVGTSWGAIH